MGNRRFEMHEYRHILARMRQGESNRSLAKTGLIGRNKAAVLRSTAHRHGWLETTSPLPDDQELARVLAVPAIRQQDSSLASYAREIKGWHSMEFPELLFTEHFRKNTVSMAVIQLYADSCRNSKKIHRPKPPLCLTTSPVTVPR